MGYIYKRVAAVKIRAVEGYVILPWARNGLLGHCTKRLTDIDTDIDSTHSSGSSDGSSLQKADGRVRCLLEAVLYRLHIQVQRLCGRDSQRGLQAHQRSAVPDVGGGLAFNYRV